MNPLIARIRKQRELKIAVDKFTFICQRPTDVQAVDWHNKGGAYNDIAQRFVVGWEGVTERDIVTGGGGDAVPFDQDLWLEWCADRPDFWAPIANGVLEAYQLHADRLDVAEKK